MAVDESLETLLGPMSEETRLLLHSAPPAVLTLVGVIAALGWQLDCAPVKGAARLQFSREHWRQVAVLRWRKVVGVPPRTDCDVLPPATVFADSFLPGVAQQMSLCGFTIQKLTPPAASSFDGSLCLLNPAGDLTLLVELFQGKGR